MFYQKRRKRFAYDVSRAGQLIRDYCEKNNIALLDFFVSAYTKRFDGTINRQYISGDALAFENEGTIPSWVIEAYPHLLNEAKIT